MNFIKKSKSLFHTTQHSSCIVQSPNNKTNISSTTTNTTTTTQRNLTKVTMSESTEPVAKKIKTGYEEHILNISEAVMKGDEADHFKELLGKSVSTMQGIGTQATEVVEHLGLDTVQDLADYKYFKWARALSTLAETETEGGRLEGSMMNVDKMVTKEYETKSLKEIVDSPVAALQGLSDAAGVLLGDLHVKTVGELATFKYCRWAEAIVVASEHENEGTEAERKVERAEKKLE